MAQSHIENPMGSASIPLLLWKMSIPMMLSLMVCSLYNVVDSIFVSRLSEQALTALSLAAPVQAMMAALGSGIAVGLNAAVSKALGEKNRQKVRESASASMFLALCAYLLIAVACLLFTESYFRWQSGGNEEIAAYGRSYLRICMLFSFGQMAQWVFDRCLMATGRSSLFLVSLASASIINLILDPILIFGWGAIPALGTSGAAIATVLGQIFGACLGAWLNLKWNREIPLHFTLHVRIAALRDILRVGIPTALMQAVVALTNILMNMVLQAFSSTAVAIYGICSRIHGLAIIAPNGFNFSLVPIAAYNYGARRRDRIYAALRWAIVDALILMGVVLLILMLFPAGILGLFHASEHMLRIGVPALRLIGLSYFLSVFCLAYASLFQALGNGNYSMILTLLRQAILPLGFALLFSQSGNILLVWASFPLAELLGIPCALPLFRRIRRDILDQLPTSA